jgi:hypothetical protein
MPSVILKNLNGSLKIRSKDVILESSCSSDVSSPECNDTYEKFQEQVQNVVAFNNQAPHYSTGSSDVSGVQWVEHAAVPLYSDAQCITKVGLAYFKDESIGITYGADHNKQMVVENGSFVICDGAQTTSLQYSLAFAGYFVDFADGSYNLPLTSSFDNTLLHGADFNRLSVSATDSHLRELDLSSTGGFGKFVTGKYYWTTNDFKKSNDYGYANNSKNYWGAL